jgi:2-methylcitrate dehydratase PrpD
MTTTTDITGTLARYMAAGAHYDTLPDAVRTQAKFRILDTFAAMVSGARLPAGTMALSFARSQGGPSEATVVASSLRTTAINAALANAMFAHADETDDFDPVTKAHPGSHVVPAALALAERGQRSGAEFIAAVTLGYDVCCRFLRALDPALVRGSHRSAEGTSSTMGAVGAGALLTKLDEKRSRYALSYAAQQVSGIWSWVRDGDHVEKAFDFSGMGARNGVTAALLAEAGFTGVWDVLDGEHNALIALSSAPRPEEMVAALGQRHFVTETAIKPYSIGYPIQAPLAAFLSLLQEHRFKEGDVSKIVVRLPEDGARVVNNRNMPDVNCQHVIAVALLDGAVSFDASHDYERMQDPRVLALRQRIELVAAADLMDPEAPRSGHVLVSLRDGRTVECFVRHAPGTKENPMSQDDVNRKAADLIGPVLGPEQTRTLIARVNALEKVDDMREIATLMAVPA